MCRPVVTACRGSVGTTYPEHKGVTGTNQRGAPEWLRDRIGHSSRQVTLDISNVDAAGNAELQGEGLDRQFSQPESDLVVERLNVAGPDDVGCGNAGRRTAPTTASTATCPALRSASTPRKAPNVRCVGGGTRTLTPRAPLPANSLSRHERPHRVPDYSRDYSRDHSRSHSRLAIDGVGTLGRCALPGASWTGEHRGVKRVSVLLAVTCVRLAAGVAASPRGASTTADVLWAATGAVGLAAAFGWVIASLIRHRLGVDVIAVFALAGAARSRRVPRSRDRGGHARHQVGSSKPVRPARRSVSCACCWVAHRAWCTAMRWMSSCRCCSTSCARGPRDGEAGRDRPGRRSRSSATSPCSTSRRSPVNRSRSNGGSATTCAVAPSTRWTPSCCGPPPPPPRAPTPASCGWWPRRRRAERTVREARRPLRVVVVPVVTPVVAPATGGGTPVGRRGASGRRARSCDPLPVIARGAAIAIISGTVPCRVEG